MANGRRSPGGGRASEGGLGISCYQTNDESHGYTGGVEGDKNHVMQSPKVYAIYWDEYFEMNREAVYTMDEFFRQILTGRYMRQLNQYGGIGLGRFLGSTVIVPNPVSPPPSDLAAERIEAELKEWIRTGTVKVSPTPGETNLLYVIFTPSTTTIDNDNCLAGFHSSGRYDAAPDDAGAQGERDDNLFWAAIQEWHYDGAPASASDFADSCTWAVSHELVEAFTNRDGKGFAYRTPKDHYEIGDICECARGSEAEKTPIIKTEVDGWWVETYWDEENKSCYPLHVVPRDYAPEVGYEIPRRPNEQRYRRRV